MRGSVKIAKGRVEEAAGSQVYNNNLRAKGQTDQATGCIVDKANDVTQPAINRPRGECSVFQSNM
jgi:uncharacterized protein YjbJ (UPF0337 family)